MNRRFTWPMWTQEDGNYEVLFINLQEQKRRIEANAIMEAYLKSGKSFDEIMTFLTP